MNFKYKNVSKLLNKKAAIAGRVPNTHVFAKSASYTRRLNDMFTKLAQVRSITVDSPGGLYLHGNGDTGIPTPVDPDSEIPPQQLKYLENISKRPVPESDSPYGLIFGSNDGSEMRVGENGIFYIDSHGRETKTAPNDGMRHAEYIINNLVDRGKLNPGVKLPDKAEKAIDAAKRQAFERANKAVSAGSSKTGIQPSDNVDVTVRLDNNGKPVEVSPGSDFRFGGRDFKHTIQPIIDREKSKALRKARAVWIPTVAGVAGLAATAITMGVLAHKRKKMIKRLHEMAQNSDNETLKTKIKELAFGKRKDRSARKSKTGKM